ncbi:MAG: ABC transporter ATP-binding protein [Zestosphaera sp.]
MYLVETRDLVYEYPDGTKALSGVDLAIKEGEFVGILGNNGSGKTTLVRCIAGLIKPSSGSVLVKGRNISEYGRRDLVRLIGFISQDVNTQLLNVTVLSEILFTARVIGVEKELTKIRLNEILKQVGIGDDLLEKPVLSLPRYMKLRVLLASYMLAGTRNFIVDEPTTGQDWYRSVQFIEVLRRLREGGATVVLVTHDVELLSKYSERVIVMHSGRVVADGETRDVLSDVSLLRKYSLTSTYTALIAQEVARDARVLLPEDLIKYLKALGFIK